MKPIKPTQKIVVRACVGCILSTDAKLIGQGIYIIKIGESNQYYDYEIDTATYDDFVLQNQKVLIDNGLLKVEKSQEELEKEEQEKLAKEQYTGFPGGYKRKTY